MVNISNHITTSIGIYWGSLLIGGRFIGKSDGLRGLSFGVAGYNINGKPRRGVMAMRFPLVHSDVAKKYFAEHVWFDFMGATDLELTGLEKILPHICLGLTQSLYCLSPRRNSITFWENHLYYVWLARPWDYAPQVGECLYQIIMALRKLIGKKVKSLYGESDE